MNHIKLEITANEYQQEELIALFDDYNAAGFEQTDEKLIAYFVEDAYQKDEILKILEGYHFESSTIAEQNWNAMWERNFHPVVVDDFCAVRAHFHEPILNVAHEVIITPKMSFGTGHHATTYMMMEQMRDIDFKGKSVFDFGTGTGVLAILAEKLGAQKINAIDIDEWSITNAEENVERNHCQKIKISQSTIIPVEKFDVILANINRNVILDYLQQLINTLQPNGLILFSGLLVADEDAIMQSATGRLKLIKQRERQGWLSLLLAMRTS